MALKERLDIDFEQVLAMPDPVGALRNAVVVELHERGASRDALLASLDEQRVAYRSAGREREQDAVIEIMERLSGWSAPSARI